MACSFLAQMKYVYLLPKNCLFVGSGESSVIINFPQTQDLGVG